MPPGRHHGVVADPAFGQPRTAGSRHNRRGPLDVLGHHVRPTRGSPHRHHRGPAHHLRSPRHANRERRPAFGAHVVVARGRRRHRSSDPVVDTGRTRSDEAEHDRGCTRAVASAGHRHQLRLLRRRRSRGQDRPDWYSGDPITMPIGIAELGIPGVESPPSRPRSTAGVAPTCSRSTAGTGLAGVGGNARHAATAQARRRAVPDRPEDAAVSRSPPVSTSCEPGSVAISVSTSIVCCSRRPRVVGPDRPPWPTTTYRPAPRCRR